MEDFEAVTPSVDYEETEVNKEWGRIGCANYD